MPKGIDWINFLYVNIAFIAQVFAMYWFISVSDIKKNWPNYRCNPIFMPLADNIEENFVYCVQNMQSNYMGYLLQPITYILNSLTSLGGDFSSSLNYTRTMISNIRSFITTITQNVFGVFLNLVIEFQKITISIKDLVGKIIGAMVALMYLIDGSVKTMQSTWNGPPGQMVKAIGGMCFYPETKVKLKDGTVVNMKDLNLGDILENGSRVDVIMKLKNIYSENLYKIKNNFGNIYVTGSHMIYSEKDKKYIEVKNHSDAIEQKEIKSDWFSCLITDDHKIKIGDYTFWDWEDDILKV